MNMTIKEKPCNTEEEIQENFYLCNLVNEIEECYQMYGRFVHYTTAQHPQYNGYYFVSGYDSRMVNDPNLNLEEIYKQQGKRNLCRLNLFVTKVTDQSPFAVYRKIMKNCFYSSTIRALFNKFDVSYNDPVLLVPTYYVDNAISLYQLYNKCPCYENEEVMRKYLQTKGEWGETKPTKAQKTWKLFKKNTIPNQMEKYEDMVDNCEKIYRAIVTKEELEELEKALACRPEIYFFEMPPKDLVTILYDGFYHQAVDEMLLRIRYPQCFEYSLEDLKADGDEHLYCLGVDLFDLPVLFEKAKRENVPLCIDTNQLYFTCKEEYFPEENEAGYTVVFPYSRHRDLHYVLREMVKEARGYHVLTESDKEKFSYANGQFHKRKDYPYLTEEELAALEEDL